VLAIFRVRWNGVGLRETILPKGNVDYLFNLGEPLHATGPRPDGYFAEEGCAWVGGLRTRAHVVQPQGRVDLLGVSMRAECCAGLLPLPPSEFTNQVLQGDGLPPDARTVAEQVREARSFGEQVAILTRWLIGRLRPLRGAQAVRHACALLRQSRAEDPVGTTARTLGVSLRHLRRMVTEQVGVGPAEYVRVARFIRATELMTAPERTLAQVALSAGYYDQAHFCRDFRAFADMTPQDYRRRANGPVAGHIIEGRSVQDASP
jgi:AraC-like DNA-binding protein